MVINKLLEAIRARPWYLCILPFFNPLTSLDCWENEIQPHFVFIAPKYVSTKCLIIIFEKDFQQSESWSGA